MPFDVRSWSLQTRLTIAVTIPTTFSIITALIGFNTFQRYNPTATTATATTVALILFAVGALSVIVSLLVISIVYVFVVRPFQQLRDGIERVSNGVYDQPIPVGNSTEDIAITAHIVNNVAAQLARDFQNLESSIAQRTRDLEAARDIGQILSSLRDVRAISDRVIALIQERFADIYHAQVFLIDDRRVDAVLRASTGEVGQRLLARGHRLEVGSRSVIGQVTARGEPVIALDTASDAIHKVNELLPETRSELALPMRTSEGIIGALDLQSRRADAFTESDMRLFQTIADQLSIAVQNARLFEELQARLKDIEDLNRLLIGDTWKGYVESRRRRLGASPGQADDLSHLQAEALRTGRIVEYFEPDGTVRFAVPMTLRGEILGAIEWQLQRSKYSENTKLLARELANRLALAVDNARLLEESQQAASREQLLNEISGKLSRQADVSSILQLAVQELGRVLPVTQTTIRLTEDF
jgi:GAF domain-containing protein